MAHDTYSPLRCLPATCPMPHAPCPCPLCSHRDVAFAYSCAQFLGIGSSDSNFVPMIVVAAVPLFRLPLVVRLIRIHILLPCRAVPYLATPPAAQHTLYTFSICHLKLAFFFAPAFWLAQHLSSINLNTLQPPGAARFCHSVATVACAANTICCQFSSGIKDLTHDFGLIHSSFELFRTISRLNEFFTTTTSTTKPQH